MTAKIMLVEDEIIVAMDVQQRLEILGYEVVAHAVSGEEAVQLVQKTNPNLILMDIKIKGGMDGIETAARIRDSFDIPIIYVTAFSDETTIQRASLTEAFGYLIKPFEDRELRSAIEVALYKHQMEHKLRESEERYALAARAANDGIWDWNLLSNEIYYSPRWKILLGLDEDHPLHTPQEWLERIHTDDKEKFNQAVDQHLKGYTPNIACEYRILHRDGGYRWMLCRGMALFDAQKKPYRLAGSISEITARKQIETQLVHRALHDELTQLPNRALFLDRLRMVLEQACDAGTMLAAVLFLDIDQFKVVNDSLGHICGDLLLIEFSKLLRHCLRPGDTVARFGGDEFAILLERISSKEDAPQIAERICRELQKPFTIDGYEIFTSASIGIVFVDSECKNVDDLLRDADSAMYFAKYNGRARYEIFDSSMYDRSMLRLQRETEIRRAITNNEFVLHYQPVFTINTLALVGFEALIRWQHPSRGLLPPGEFIQVAEETGLILPIGEWVLDTACKQAQAWRLESGKPLSMAINLSAVQFNDKNLIKIIQNALSQSGFSASLLELELTESAAMQNMQKSLEILNDIKQMGVSISIDDFGSGYSSLDHIRSFPTSTIKIDRSFIQEMKPDDSAIVEAIISMAHQLRLKVIAEGVETQDQLSILNNIKCDQVQGFLLGKGIPAEEIQKTVLKKVFD